MIRPHLFFPGVEGVVVVCALYYSSLKNDTDREANGPRSCSVLQILAAAQVTVEGSSAHTHTHTHKVLQDPSFVIFRSDDDDDAPIAVAWPESRQQ